MKKVFLGNDPWSKELKDRVRKSAHYLTILHWKKHGTKIRKEETPYWEFMKNVINSRSWGDIIKNKNDAAKQYIRYLELFKAYPNWNVKKNIYTTIDGANYYYGGIMVKVGNDGKFWIYDGNHRIAVLLFYKKPVEITICSRNTKWQEFIDDLTKLYPAGLYQSIPHPDFSDWAHHDSNTKDKIIRKIFIDFKIKTVFEFGSCHGHILYSIRDLLTSAIGVELDPVRFKITKLVYDNIGFSSWEGDIYSFIKNKTEEWDCCLALAVFHHFSRLNDIDKFIDLIDCIKKRSKILVYELPAKNEEQYKWIYPEINMHDLLKSRYKYSYTYSISHRDIHVLTDKEKI